MRHTPISFSAACLFSVAIQAADTVPLDIPAQPMSSAVEQLGRQTGMQILYPAEALAGKTSQAVSGRYTPQQALNQLLAGSGLLYRFADARTVAISAGNRAQEDPSLRAGNREQPVLLDKVVVTATKTERLISEVPATVATVDAKQIDNMYSRDSSDLLTRSAGVDISRAGTNGISSLNIRGVGNRRSSVLVNGQYAEFLDTGLGNQSTLQTIDWDNIERLEIVRGAGSALYGPNAMGGVVNIITKEAPEQANVTRPFFVFDSLPTYGGGFSTGGTLDGFSYQLNFKHLNSAGYKTSPKPAFYPGYPGTTSHSLRSGDWDRTLLGGKLGYQISDRDRVKFAFNYMDESMLAFDRPKTPQDGSFGQYSLEYKHDFSDRFDVTTTVSHRSHMANLTWDNYFYPFRVDNLVYDSTLYENAQKLTGEVRARWTPLDGHTFLFGYNAAQDWSKLHRVAGIDGADLETKKSSITNHGLYLQYEFEWDKRLFVTVGGRGDWFDYDLDAKFASPATVRQNKTGFETFNPRGGIRYKFNDGFAVRANIGRGFRAPDPVYVVGGVSGPFVEFLSNSALQPEKTDSFDFGIDVDTDFGLHMAATGFFNDITNYISVARYRQANKTIIQGQNLAKVQTYGAELELTQRITDALSLFTNYTHTVAQTAADLPPTATGLPKNGFQLPNVPEDKAAFGLSYDSRHFSGRLEGRYVSNQYISGDTTNQDAFSLPSYVVADINATYKFALDSGQSLDLTAGINNIFDRQYQTRTIGYYGEPRVGFVRVGLQF